MQRFYRYKHPVVIVLMISGWSMQASYRMISEKNPEFREIPLEEWANYHVNRIADKVKPEKKQEIKQLAYFVLSKIQELSEIELREKQPNLIFFNLRNSISQVLERERIGGVVNENTFKENHDLIMGYYFVTLLRNTNPYEIATIDIYSNALLKGALERQIPQKKGLWEYFKAWIGGRQDLYCAIFKRYVDLLLLQELPDKEVVQKNYQDFLAQLFILAQQDRSGKCWDNAISFIKNMEYSEEIEEEIKQKKAYFLEAMAQSALINYATLYQMNHEAAEIEKTTTQKMVGIAKKYYNLSTTYMKSWRYIYFLASAAQALKEVDETKFTVFLEEIGNTLQRSGIPQKDIPSLETFLKNVIEEPTTIQQMKAYLSQVPKKELVAGTITGLAAFGGIITLAYNINIIKKDFGAARADGILAATGAGFMAAGRILYETVGRGIRKMGGALVVPKTWYEYWKGKFGY